MAKKMRIKSGSVEVTADLNDSKTAEAIWKALPLKSRANRWGDEIYFSIPVSLGADNATETVKVGDLGYWPAGNGFCIFFGPTPISEGKEPRPASPCNLFGKVVGDATVLRRVASGSEITVEKLAES
jgi:hypothetical protein